MEKVCIVKNEDVDDCKENDGKEFIETDKKLEKVEKKPSLVDRRVTWGERKEKVGPKDPSMYVESSIENDHGERKSKNYLTKDTKMMGKQKPTKQLQLDDAFPMLSQGKRNVLDMEGIELVHDEEAKNLLTKETKDEVIRRMSKNDMIKVLSEWKNTYKTYKKEFLKLNIYQLRSEVKKLRDGMLSMKTTRNVETIVQQNDSTKIAKGTRKLIEIKSGGKDTNKTPVKSKKKKKIGSDYLNQNLPIVTTRDNLVVITPRTSDSSLTKLKKDQLLELVTSWANFNGTVSNVLFKEMNKSSLVSEAKRVRKALTKAWTKKYNISMKSNTEGYTCINKKTTDEEIRNLDIEKLIRILQWWNVEWGREHKDENYNMAKKCELIEEVLKVRDELVVSRYPKVKELGAAESVSKDYKAKSETGRVHDLARKMTPLEKESSEWFEKAGNEVKERTQRWCDFKEGQGIPKLTTLIKAKKSYELAKDVKISITDRDVTSLWDRSKLFAVLYWKQPIDPCFFKMEDEICEYDDDGIAELIDELHGRASLKGKKKSNKRKQREVTTGKETTQESELLTNEELEQLTEKENDKKAMDWYKESEGEVRLRIDRYIEENVKKLRETSIIEMASIAWKAYESQSDIKNGSILETLPECHLQAYWYYFQKMDNRFRKWDDVRSEKKKKVLSKVFEMLQKTRLKLGEDGIKTFLFNRAFTEEETKLLHWKYSSGPMIVAKVKKFELEVEKELGSNVEVEIHAIRTSYLWSVNVLKNCNFRKVKRDEIDSLHKDDLRITTYWNQKQDVDHVTFGVIKHMGEEKLIKLATRVCDWVKRFIDYSVIDLDVITPPKTEEVGDIMMTERDSEKLSDSLVKRERDENAMEIDENIEYNNEFDGKGIEDDVLADLDIEMNELQKDFLPIVTPPKPIRNRNNRKKISLTDTSPNTKQTTIENFTTEKGQSDNELKNGIKIVPKQSQYIKEGININMMSTNQRKSRNTLGDYDKLTPLPLGHNDEVHTSSETTPVLKMRDVTARFEITVDDAEKVNIPIVAKQAFRLFKQADRTCRLMPFYGNDNDDLEAIDEEDGIPCEESKIKMWIDNPRFLNSRLQFNMRISTMVQLKHIKDTLFPWMAKNKSFVRLDNLRCREIHCIGCIVDVHTSFYNRYMLKDFIRKELEKNGYKSDFNLYARNVWNIHKGEKVVTRAIVMEVDKVNKDFAIDAMIGVDFKQEYSDAKFVPFNKAQFPSELMNKIMIANNSYHAKTRKRKIEGLDEIYTVRQNMLGSELTIQNWLSNQRSTMNMTKLFERVERNVYGETVIIFDMNMTDEVNKFLSELKTKMIEEFPDRKGNIESKVRVPLLTSESTKRSTYAQALVAMYQKGQVNNDSAKSHFPINPPSSSRLYYGNSSGKIKKSYVNHLMKEQVDKTQKADTQCDGVESTAEVVKKLDEITAKQIAIEESMKKKFLEIVNEKKKSNMNEVQETEERMTSMMDEKLKKLEGSIDVKLNRMQERHTGEINKVFSTFEKQLQNAMETQESLMQSMQDQMRLTMSKQSIVQQSQHNEMLNEVKSSIVKTFTSLSQSQPEVATSHVKIINEEESGESPQ